MCEQRGRGCLCKQEQPSFGGKKKREALGSLSSPLRQALFCEESEFLGASGNCGFGRRSSEGCVSCHETAQWSGLSEKTEVKERRRGCVDVGAQQQLPEYRLIDFFFRSWKKLRKERKALMKSLPFGTKGTNTKRERERKINPINKSDLFVLL